MVFPVVMYGCDNWTIRKVERWRTDGFDLWYRRRFSWESLDCKVIKPSILKEINPEYSLEGMMLKLKLQSFCHLMQRTDSLEKTLILGKIEGRRRKMTEDGTVGCYHWLNGHEFEKLQELVMNREAWRAAVHGGTKSWSWLSNWPGWTDFATLWAYCQSR